MDSLRNFPLMPGYIIIDGFSAEFSPDRWSYSLMDAMRNLSLMTGHIIIDGISAEFPLIDGHIIIDGRVAEFVRGRWILPFQGFGADFASALLPSLDTVRNFRLITVISPLIVSLRNSHLSFWP